MLKKVNWDTLSADVAAWIFFSASAGLSVNMFIQISSEPTLKIIWGVIAFAIELFKRDRLLLAKKLWLNKKKTEAIKPVLWYAGLVSLSIVASLGFALVSTDNQSKVAKSNNLQIEILENKINRMSTDLETKSLQMRNLVLLTNDTYKNSSKEYSRQISVLEIAQVKALKELERLNLEDGVKTVIDSSKMFALLAKPLKNTDGEGFKFILLLVLAIFIEAGIAVLSKTEGSKSLKVTAIRSDKPNLVAYLNAALAVKIGVSKLNSDKKVAEMTGLPQEVCTRYRNMLASEIKYNGLTVVERKPGGTMPRFKKETILRVINAKFATL